MHREAPLFTAELPDATVRAYSVRYLETAPEFLDFELAATTSSTASPQLSYQHLPPHLTPGNEILVFDSVHSGTGRARRDVYSTVLLPIFNDLNIRHRYIQSTDAGSSKRFAESVDLRVPTTVVFVSGDTTVTEFVNNLRPQTAPQGPHGPPGASSGARSLPRHRANSLNVAIVAMGTSNAIFNSASAGQLTLFDSIRRLFSHTSHALPIYKASLPAESYLHGDGTEIRDSLLFLVLISWASHADMVTLADSPDLRPFGVERFKMAFEKVLADEARLVHNGVVVVKDGSGSGSGGLGSGSRLGLGLRPETQPDVLQQLTAHKLTYLTIIALPKIESNYLISPGSNVFQNELQVLSLSQADPAAVKKFLMEPYKLRDSNHLSLPQTRYETVRPGHRIELVFRNNTRPSTNLIVDGFKISIKNPLDKSVAVSFTTPEELGFAINWFV